MKSQIVLLQILYNPQCFPSPRRSYYTADFNPWRLCFRYTLEKPGLRREPTLPQQNSPVWTAGSRRVMRAQRLNRGSLRLHLLPSARGVTEPTGHHIRHVAHTHQQQKCPRSQLATQLRRVRDPEGSRVTLAGEKLKSTRTQNPAKPLEKEKKSLPIIHSVVKHLLGICMSLRGIPSSLPLTREMTSLDSAVCPLLHRLLSPGEDPRPALCAWGFPT